MSKIWVIAAREYKAAVKTKAFIITIVLMPILMSASGVVQHFFNRLEKDEVKIYAVIDRTPGQKLIPELQEVADNYNKFAAVDLETGEPRSAQYKIEVVPPSESTPEAMNDQRYELSQRIELGVMEKDGQKLPKIEALVEIGADVLKVDLMQFLPKDLPKLDDPKSLDPKQLMRFLDSDKIDDNKSIRFQAKNPTASTFRFFVEKALNDAIHRQRIMDQTNLTKIDVILTQLPVPVKNKSLTRKNTTGGLEDGSKQDQIVNLLLPAVLIGMMFMIIMIGATPAMQGVVEEKTLRISEVLLGSVTPFQLMGGKLLGLIRVSMTMATVYLVGGYILAQSMGFADVLTPSLICWFLIMLVMALMIFGSLFIAVGAAANDIKETQTLLMPIMMMAMIPFFALGPIMKDPNGPVAQVCSFFPFATPMLLVARQSVPPGVPLWEMLAGIALVIATTIACVWAAGRVFRIGILMQGKGAKFSDLIRWIFKG